MTKHEEYGTKGGKTMKGDKLTITKCVPVTVQQ